MFIKFVNIDWLLFVYFLPLRALWEVVTCNLPRITCLFVKFGENLSRSFFEILKSKLQKKELGKFIPNFPLKHVFTSTNSCPERLFST